MGLKIIIQPTVTPISVVGLDLLKNHLQEATDVSDEDVLITAFLNAAWALAESHTWRQFLTAEYRYTLSSFFAQNQDNRSSRLLIPRPPCQSIDSVKYYDADGVLTTLVVTTDYIVDDESDIWSLWPAIGKSWPNVQPGNPKAVQIEFTAGYGDTLAAMPDIMLHAVRLQVGSWWRNRESVDPRQQYELPAATKALLETIEIRDDRLVTDRL